MPALSRIIRIETHYGAPVESASATITPVSRALIVNLGRLAFVWNRPAAVLVEQDDSRRRLPIPDPTGLFLAAVAIVTLTLTAYFMSHRRR